MIFLTWKDYITDINTLISKYEDQLCQYNYIYAIPRGGNIIGTIISYTLNIPMLFNITTEKNILIVDDICDTGKTLSLFKNNHDILTLYVNSKNKSYPCKYWLSMVSEWVIFPYEYDNDTNIFHQDTISERSICK